ncbi:hypothetical protein ASG73_16295 [Janibacter sp. Soil728]|uniref:GNAT family N-acetyltransferase n=1 Tax=Janibacter sp. Soil728 TaxID=1736393 RepID=UPI0006F459D8|nr:GNAT family N-acetyltransferase [Janibacter sp. Soil728]KRE35494.1 hypothetical protein ASG73_16295 [Janibacter sp. Soil728]
MSDHRLGPMTTQDPALLARVHESAFPEFFLSALGLRFLTEFYAGFLGDPTAVAVVARDAGGVVVGAAVGTTEPAGYYRRLLRRRLAGLVVASAVAAARRPKAILRLARGAFYRGEAGDDGKPTGALLSSICTAPSAQNTGLGKRLLVEWEYQARAKGASTAHLSTDARDNDAANGFYRSSGWVLDREYRTREGRLMNLYRKALA